MEPGRMRRHVRMVIRVNPMVRPAANVSIQRKNVKMASPIPAGMASGIQERRVPPLFARIVRRVATVNQTQQSAATARFRPVRVKVSGAML